MNLETYFKNGSVYVWDETFAIIKAKAVVPDAFVNIVDKHEITVIIDQKFIDTVDVIELEKNWKIFTLDIVFPMDVCGVTATIGTALANAGISIMPIAAYSRDHFLIKDQDVEKAKEVFQTLSIRFVSSN